MSEHVTTGIASENQSPSHLINSRTVMQRKCACGSYGAGGQCDKCRGESTTLQRSANRSGHVEALPPLVDQALSSTGRPLDSGTRKWMEPRFGHDFSNVRVHTDESAARSAKAVNALAYTVGRDLVFASGEYAPSTERGSRLLVHELTHVVQQSRAANPAAQPAKAISEPSDAAELEADNAADQVLRGESISVKQAPNAQLHALSDEAKGGIIAGSIAGGIGLGLLIANWAGAFDRERFSESELLVYLRILATTRHIQGDRDSDNKARDVVRKWQSGDPTFNINDGFNTTGASLSGVELKRLLIKEMLDGVTGDADERAILAILERSQPDEIRQLLDPAHGVSPQRLDDKIGGANHDRLEAILERAFPRSSQTGIREGTNSSCSARQALMVSYAKERALILVDNVINVLTKRQDDPNLRGALECRFPGARAADVARIRDVFIRVRAQLPTRVYYCGAEGGASALEPNIIRKPTGEELVAQCFAEDADSFLRQGVAFPDVFLCGSFFGRSPDTQAITIVHESVHAAGIATDPAYQPGCGLPLATGLTNPDSFAYFANDLMQPLPGISAPNVSEGEPRLPAVSVGNFRNHGAVSPENESPVAQEIPGLGIDMNTGLNIMELRGDISGHRPGIEYDFKRTKEVGIWKRVGESWQQIRYQPRGTEDDNTERDEDNTPTNNHIYSLDGPGLMDLSGPIPGAFGADEAVYKGSFVEFVHARMRPGSWTPVSNQFEWHTITWLEKVNGSWQRVAGANEIEEGSTFVGQGSPYGLGDFEVPQYPDGNIPA